MYLSCICFCLLFAKKHMMVLYFQYNVYIYEMVVLTIEYFMSVIRQISVVWSLVCRTIAQLLTALFYPPLN